MWRIIKKILQLFGLIESDKDKYSREIGEEGESKVAKIFKDNDVKYLNNLYLPHRYGYTEIDLLIITKVGIFVTEVKNYNNCRVEGTSEEEKWMVYYKSGKTYDMYNPIKQNDGHIKTLLKYITINTSKYIYSIIVFSDNADLKVKNNRAGVYVINERDLEKFIDKIKNSKDNMTRENIIQIYNELSQYTVVDDRIKREHKKSVKKYVNKKKG